MRNELKTRFWRTAYDSLPPAVRAQYHAELAFAERWELMLDALVDAVSGAKAALVRLFQAPQERHGH